MHNQFLREPTARDINQRIDRVLRDLGARTPPIRLEEVRELLKLDRVYYSSSDGGVLRETIHRLKVAGKQLLARPTLLIDAVRKWDLKALWLPDRQCILIDADLPRLKHRWSEAHEITHSLLPWHDVVTHGDQQRTLSPPCHLQLEVEANYGGGRLLFLGEQFRQNLVAGSISFDQVKALASLYGNTMTTTLWRVVENLDIPAVGLVSCHPHAEGGAADEPIRYFIRSRRFAHEFSHVEPLAIFGVLGQFCRNGKGPIGQSEVTVSDANGLEHVFFFETFHNSHEALTLGIHRHVRSGRVIPCGA